MILFKKRFQYLAFVAAVIVVSSICALTIQVVFAGWEEPQSAPPDNNVPGPIWNNSGLIQDAYFKIKGGVFGDDSGKTTVIGAWPGQNAGDITTDGKIVAQGDIVAQRFCLGAECIDKWNTMTENLQTVTDQGNITTNPITVQDNLTVGKDLYLTDGKAIRVDKNGADSKLYIGNWGGSGNQVGVEVEGTLTVNSAVAIADKLTVHDNFNKRFLDLDSANKIIKIGDMDTTNGANFTIDANQGGKFTFTNGNVGIGTDTPTAKLQVEGDLKVSGCFGPMLIGETILSYTGDINRKQGGYETVNALCDSQFSGSHACTSTEILNSINCNNQPPNKVTGYTWISNGPPGYTALANDCKGWTSSSPNGGENVYGAVWNFNTKMGWLTACNVPNRFACCK